MTIDEIISNRGIKEIMHFTTNRGLVGVLHTNSLKSRSRLEEDKQLEFIFSANAAFRKDKEWLDYVSLSISRINRQFFSVSAGRWHREKDIWWCILSFSPSILNHSGVYFTTTNNIYTRVKREMGAAALEAMFADRIVRWDGNVVSRSINTPQEFTTCEQAEVLYPGEVPVSYLRRIYVATEEDSDEVYGLLNCLPQQDIEVKIAPEQFNEAEY